MNGNEKCYLYISSAVTDIFISWHLLSLSRQFHQPWIHNSSQILLNGVNFIRLVYNTLVFLYINFSFAWGGVRIILLRRRFGVCLVADVGGMLYAVCKKWAPNRSILLYLMLLLKCLKYLTTCDLYKYVSYVCILMQCLCKKKYYNIFIWII